MKSLFLLLLVTCAAVLRAETLQDIITTFPVGTSKDAILKNEPSAKVVPCMITPIDATARRECIVLMKSTEKNRMIAQFYLVNDTLAAMLLSTVAMPGATGNSKDETAFISARRKVSSFPALRVDSDLKPVEIQVERFALDQSNLVALLASTSRGKELWIIDETAFDPKTFFMEPTADNRSKILKNKEAIDAQRKSYEETK